MLEVLGHLEKLGLQAEAVISLHFVEVEGVLVIFCSLALLIMEWVIKVLMEPMDPSKSKCEM